MNFIWLISDTLGAILGVRRMCLWHSTEFIVKLSTLMWAEFQVAQTLLCVINILSNGTNNEKDFSPLSTSGSLARGVSQFWHWLTQ